MTKRLRSYYNYIFAAVFGLGIFLRLILFIKNPSLFYDEASLALNITENSYTDLLKGLNYNQVAPPGFLLLSKFLYEILSPFNEYLRDLSLRIVPFISGIIVLPATYFFVSNLNKNKFIRAAALFVIAFNPLAINYCVQFKQYSLELLISIILLTTFYKIIFKNESNHYNILLIALAPWFSLSSIFVIASGLIIILKQNLKKVGAIFLPLVTSLLILYAVSIKYVLKMNFNSMIKCFEGAYGFLAFNHPLRIFIRFGELFSYNKIASIIFGIFILLSCVGYFITGRIFLKKLFLLLPLILTLCVSLLHFYPLDARLVLFLLPVFAVCIAEYYYKLYPAVIIVFCMISFILSLCYFPAPTATSHREAVNYLTENINSSDRILIDADYNTYKYYMLNNPTEAEPVQIPFICGKSSQQPSCSEFITKLAPGRYYFIAPSKLPEEIIPVSVQIINYTPFNKSTVIYFDKKNN